MTCADFKEQVGALAAGALDPAERQACERHLGLDISHEGCVEAFARANDAAALLGLALPPVEPAADVWRAIEAKLAPAPALAGRPRWNRGARLAAGFAAAAAIAGVAVFARLERATQNHLRGDISVLRLRIETLEDAAVGCQSDLESARSDLAAQHEALAMLQLSSTSVIALAPQTGAAGMRASAIYNPQQGHAMFVASGFMPHAGKDYELWVIRGKDKVAAGLLHGDASGALVMRVEPTLFASGAPDAFAVTLEPVGGGSTPRGPIMMVGALAQKG